MKAPITLVLFLIFIATSIAQSISFVKEKIAPFNPVGIVAIEDINDQYLFNLVNVETQDASQHIIKHKLINIKNEIALSYPKKEINPINSRGDSDPPKIVNGFYGHLGSTGIPLDNHLASNGEQILIAMNNHFAMRTIDGTAIIGFSLDHFAQQVGLDGHTFDPRVLYDPESDRYIGAFLHGTESGNTGIAIMFSQSNDITGEWSVYSLPGNPFSGTTWTDYPMINITATDLIITANLIRDNEPWETGFEKTILWQLDKQNGYSGNAINSILWQELEYNGMNIRNLCPIESGDHRLESNSYYLSNRNFDIANDTIFFVELSGGVSDESATLTIEVLTTDQPYGVPPNATQSKGYLQTNDARILEGFYHHDQIQFVGNTRNPVNNKAGIYHGIIDHISGSKQISLKNIIPDDQEIGYPGITYTGVGDDESDAIIHFSHTSAEEFAGVSAMYYDPIHGYSEIIAIKSGDNYIDELDGEVERWGDYAGSQREFYLPGQCIISGTVGVASRSHRPWVARLTRPLLLSDSEDLAPDQRHLDVYPNPVADRISFKFDIPEDATTLQITLHNSNGQVVDILKKGAIHKTGVSLMSFSIGHLVDGNYYVTVVSNHRTIMAESFIKQ